MALCILDHSCDREYTVIFERHLPSQVELKDQLIADIIEEMDKRSWVSEDDRHWLLLSLDEAIVNAMIHGNEGDPSLHIELELAHNLDESSWIIVVRDEGDGFVAEDVPDSDNPESLLLEHGRGILLMGEWLDELTYFDGGSTIYMSKLCQASQIPEKND